MMNALSLLVSGCTSLAWLLPTPGGRGMATGVGMLAVLMWFSRLDCPGQRRVLIAACTVVLATACQTDVPTLLVGAVGIIALGAGGGSVGMVALGAGGLWFLTFGRLEPAALLAGLAALRREQLSPHRPVLASAVVLGLLGSFGSALAGRGIAVAPRSAGSIARSALAEVLDDSNSGVMARSVYAEMTSPRHRSAAHALEHMGELERRTGSTAITAALRIVSTKVAGGDARARVVEAVLRVPAAMDSLEEWNDEALPWRDLASCLHLGRPLLQRVSWPSAQSLLTDSLSAEYAARLMQDIGLEAEACTLASLPQWRQRGWARYIVWKACEPWEAPRVWAALSRHPHRMPEGRWLLVRGQPARGAWPVCRVWNGGSAQELFLSSEAWTLEPRVVRTPAWISLLNDLWAPGEDRNADLAFVERFDDAWFVEPPRDMERFRQQVVTRIAAWGTPGEAHDEVPVPVCLDSAEEVPASWTDGVPVDGGWMLAGPGRIRWHSGGSGHVLVMRGQPAAGRWPIAELTWQDHVARLVVDSSSWTCYRLSGSSPDSLSLRFVNDLWDPGAGQDRNLWIAGLFVDPSQARTNAAQ